MRAEERVIDSVLHFSTRVCQLTILTVYFLLTFMFILLFFNWRTLALQCCVSFCLTTAWISPVYTSIPASGASLPPFRVLRLQVTAKHGAGSEPRCCAAAAPGSLPHRQQCAGVRAALSVPSPSLPRSVSTSLSPVPL